MAAMKIMTLAAVMVAALLAANAAFGQTITITGTVQTLTTAQVGIACGNDLWNIQMTTNTHVTSGTLAIGNTVTVECVSADATKIPGGAAQKKENPL